MFSSIRRSSIGYVCVCVCIFCWYCYDKSFKIVYGCERKKLHNCISAYVYSTDMDMSHWVCCSSLTVFISHLYDSCCCCCCCCCRCRCKNLSLWPHLFCSTHKNNSTCSMGFREFGFGFGLAGIGLVVPRLFNILLQTEIISLSLTHFQSWSVKLTNPNYKPHI